MKKTNAKEYTPTGWLKGFLALLLSCLILIAGMMILVDPFFHYHAPLPGLFYTLSDQRSQNDGILKHFTYDAVITGTSMTENFKTSEFDALFQTRAIKVPYPGSTFHETAQALEVGFSSPNAIRVVLRGLDYSHLLEGPADMRTDMGEYPTYLYDRTSLNDVKYLYNRSAFFNFLVPTLAKRVIGAPGGITDFDLYSSSAEEEYSAYRALEGRVSFSVNSGEQSALTEEEQQLVRDNIRMNVTEPAAAHPDTEFICFFTPYSAVWYGSLLESGSFGRQMEAERIAAEEMLSCPNIRLFSFSADPAITTDLSQYKDAGHYSPQVSSEILIRIAAGENEITEENFASYQAAEEELYRGLDYNALIP